jgi:serine/tyrosine/threonine adenylyltransferase
MEFNLSNLFTSHLPKDSNDTNEPRQVHNACYSLVKPTLASEPNLIAYTEELAELLNIDMKKEAGEFLKIFSGNNAINNAESYAMCYGGHQFGHWAGQLGDGRAINIADVICNNEFYTLQLKGAGPTPYSRSADGYAVLRSSIREFLCSEAMHHLGVPTTRALSLIGTGEKVLRDVMYNGNPAYEQGAVVCRVAPNFIRFGNFEILTSRNDLDTLRQLTDFTINNFYKHLGKPSKEVYIAFLQEVADRTLEMIIHWQRVGFVHGVMNTDNMSILGLTIDYGPYGWLENFDLQWTPNTTDGNGKRYAYGQQPTIGIWNIMRLINAIFPLIEDTVPLQKILDGYKEKFSIKYLEMMANKIGLNSINDNNRKLIQSLIGILQEEEIDYTIFFRNLALFQTSESLNQIPAYIKTAFYETNPSNENKWVAWLELYRRALIAEDSKDSIRKLKMNSINPKYVLRNYMAHQAIELAENGDYTLIHEFMHLLKQPYEEQEQYEKWFAKRPDWAKEKVGCSMLSCSS